MFVGCLINAVIYRELQMDGQVCSPQSVRKSRENTFFLGSEGINGQELAQN